MTDLCGTILDANQAACALLSENGESLLGQPLASHVAGLKIRSWEEILQEIVSSPNARRFVFDFPRSDRKRHVAEAAASAVKERDGKPVGIRWILWETPNQAPVRRKEPGRPVALGMRS